MVVKLTGRSRIAYRLGMSLGSGKEIDTVFPDNYAYFEDLAQLVEQEPADLLSPNERFELASIGIEKGKPFHRDADQKAQLTNVVRLASAIAWANTFASNDPARLICPDRRWEWLFIGGSASLVIRGTVHLRGRAW
jgi:hypothetical protein